MDFYINICPGHCTGEKEKIEQYKKNLSQFQDFMDGDVAQIFSDLEALMLKHSKDLKFEEAHIIKLRLDQLKQIHDRQIVRDAVDGDHDVVVLLEKYKKTYVACLEVRNGQIV